MHDENCLFCKIIKGEIPSYKIYEDEYTYAFLDIAKDIYGHTVVISKNHSTNLMDTDNKDLYHIMDTIKKISTYYKNKCDFDGINILNNNGEAAGQSVLHLHFHILPRFNKDNAFDYKPSHNVNWSLEEAHNKLKIN